MIRIAAPAPACVAAPAGAIGRAAEAAEAQRKARASGNDAPTERAFSRTKTASPRSAQEIEIRNQACEAERRQAVCSCTQRPTFQRPMNDRPAMRGRKRTRSAAATPAAATRANPTWTPPEPDPAAATDAIGVSAALSSRPTMIRVRQIAPRPAVFFPGPRRTTAIRIASSKRPGSATPPTEAAPPAAASVSASGRSSSVKSRCQPQALKA